jgi:hypothetical protein
MVSGLDFGFADMQNARITGSWMLPSRFQRKTGEARQCVAGSESLQADPKRVIHGAVRVKLKVHWRSQDARGPGTWTTAKESRR